MSATDQTAAGSAAPSHRLWLELEPGERLCGTLGTDPNGDPHPFDGWVELMALIDAERTKDHSRQ